MKYIKKFENIDYQVNLRDIANNYLSYLSDDTYDVFVGASDVVGCDYDIDIITKSFGKYFSLDDVINDVMPFIQYLDSGNLDIRLYGVYLYFSNGDNPKMLIGSDSYNELLDLDINGIACLSLVTKK